MPGTATITWRIGVDPDVGNFLIATGITDRTIGIAIITLVAAAKAHGWWTKCYAIYPMVGGTSTTHSYNLKSAGTYTLTYSDSFTHSSTGMTPDNFTSYASTGLVPSAVMVNNDTHISFYSRTDSSVNGHDIGRVISAGSRISTHIKFTEGNWYGDQYNATERTTYVNATSTGYFLDTRTSSTNHVAYKNGAAQNTNSTASTSNISGITTDIQIGNADDSNSSRRQCAFATIGMGIDATMAADMYTDIQAFQTTLGRQV